MFKVLIFLALASSVYSNAITPSQPDNSANNQSIKRIGDGPGRSTLRHNYPTYPEYDVSGYLQQPGYQLVPKYPAPKTNVGWSSTLASSLIPFGNYALTYGGRAIILIFQFVILMLLGIFLTTSICTLTPFCTITFQGFGLTQNQLKEHVMQLARTYITFDNLEEATVFAKNAIETYTELKTQKEAKAKEENVKTTEKPKKRRRRR